MVGARASTALGQTSFYQTPVYLFVGKHLSDQLGKLNAAIAQIKRDGSYKRIFKVDP